MTDKQPTTNDHETIEQTTQSTPLKIYRETFGHPR